MPVKKCDDLLLIMSNLYSMRDGFLIMSPERMFQSTPLVKLGEQFQHVRLRHELPVELHLSPFLFFSTTFIKSEEDERKFKADSLVILVNL